MNTDQRSDTPEKEPQSLGDPLYEAAAPTSADPDESWSRRLPQLRSVTRLLLFGTSLACIAIAFFDTSMGLSLLFMSVILQTWIHSYFNQRVLGEDATGPGPVTVSKTTKLSSRITYDVTYLELAATPLAGALLILAKYFVVALR
jgi:hypothetical protein